MKAIPAVWILLVAASCSRPAPPRPIVNGDAGATAPKSTVHDVSGRWDGGAGCTPKGDEITVTGTLIVRPFGKGTNGVVVDAGGEEWILTYRAEGPLLDLAGKRVVVRGRACDKRGESISGQHFDAATLAEAI